MTSYADAGVDLEGAARHVQRIARSVTDTWGPQVVGGFGGFAAGVELPDGYKRPVLMMSTDGVGTKIELARRTGRWSGVGHDLVAMCADDLVAVGARPIGFVDYMAVGSLAPDRDEAIVASVAAACSEVGMPLLGGETAEHPGVMESDQVDLAGAAIGVVERGAEITGASIRDGDLIIGLASPNMRSNGFSLIRRVFADADLAEPFDGDTLGEILLQPSVLYSRAVLAAVATGAVTGCAHITGGGLPGNLDRPLPDNCDAIVDFGAWRRPPIFDLIAERGEVDETSMRGTFNLGIGFCLFVSSDTAESNVETMLSAVSEHDPIVIGHVTTGTGLVRFD